MIMNIISCRPGDVLESVNGVNLSNVDHCDAICAISENKGVLNLVRTYIHTMCRIGTIDTC